MLTLKNSALGNVTQSRTALAVFAATALFGGSVTEASAKPHRHHHHHHRHHHSHHAASVVGGSWRDANASIAPSSGSGRSFSGMASFYGNESGRRTASGQRFNQNAMTCAHRSLPFGTKLGSPMAAAASSSPSMTAARSSAAACSTCPPALPARSA